MGTSTSSMNVVTDNPNREVFVNIVTFERIDGYVVFRYLIKYRRFRWEIDKRFHELQKLDKKLRKSYPEEMRSIVPPPRFSKLFYTHDETFINERMGVLAAYLQAVCDCQSVFHGTVMKAFLDIGATSFNPEFGRKGKEGWLRKCSGGYVMNFSRRPGDFLNYWRRRWIVLHDNYIAWYRYSNDVEPRGILQLDAALDIVLVGKTISIGTFTRKLTLYAPTRRSAEEWVRAIHAFYKNTPRRLVLPFNSSFPPRDKTDIKVYTYSKDYMAAAAVAMLGAQKEILITSWKNSPCVLLTRPPFPPVRLDQVLRFKAEQGVKIYILLYKEVEMAGQGNDSGKAQNYLESLSPNIQCIRHPNKFIGGSTAVFWSHHEKLCVVDRGIAFVGGIDLAFNRWDDAAHSCVDEDGVRFPGKDYRQPAEGMFKPVRTMLAPNRPLPSIAAGAPDDKSSKRRSHHNVEGLGLGTIEDKYAAQTFAMSLVEEENSAREFDKAKAQSAKALKPNGRTERRYSDASDSSAPADKGNDSDEEPDKDEDRFAPSSPEEMAVCTC
jgi:hypothetical protein